VVDNRDLYKVNLLRGRGSLSYLIDFTRLTRLRLYFSKIEGFGRYSKLYNNYTNLIARYVDIEVNNFGEV